MTPGVSVIKLFVFVTHAPANKLERLSILLFKDI
jgi:hypothetical protein